MNEYVAHPIPALAEWAVVAAQGRSFEEARRMFRDPDAADELLLHVLHRFGKTAAAVEWFEPGWPEISAWLAEQDHRISPYEKASALAAIPPRATVAELERRLDHLTAGVHTWDFRPGSWQSWTLEVLPAAIELVEETLNVLRSQQPGTVCAPVGGPADPAVPADRPRAGVGIITGKVPYSRRRPRLESEQVSRSGIGAGRQDRGGPGRDRPGTEAPQNAQIDQGDLPLRVGGAALDGGLGEQWRRPARCAAVPP